MPTTSATTLLSGSREREYDALPLFSPSLSLAPLPARGTRLRLDADLGGAGSCQAAGYTSMARQDMFGLGRKVRS